MDSNPQVTTPLTHPKTNPPNTLQSPSADSRCAPFRRRQPAAWQRPAGESQTRFPKRTHHGLQSPRNHATYPSKNEPTEYPSATLRRLPVRALPPEAACRTAAARQEKPNRISQTNPPWTPIPRNHATYASKNEPTECPSAALHRVLVCALPPEAACPRGPARPALSRIPCYVTWSAGAPIREKGDHRL